jgi:cytochrome c-type biogenesis protein CcmH/NrfF
MLLWATPALALLGGLFAIWRVRRRASTGVGELELTEAEQARLAQLAPAEALKGDQRA